MKILYLHQYFTLPQYAGGTRSYDLSESFIQAGHTVVIITTNAFMKTDDKYARGWNILYKDGLEIHVYNLHYDNRLNYYRRIIVFFKFLTASSLHILRIKADAVIATSTPLTIGIPAIIKKWITGTPFIFETRDLWPEAPISLGIIRNKLLIKLLKWTCQLFYGNSEHVVALSRDMKNSILSKYRISPDKITVIPNISELSRFEKFDPMERLIRRFSNLCSAKIVLYAGTLGKVNGLSYLIELAKHTYMIDKSIVYVIFGDGKEKAELIRLSAENGLLGENIFFFNPVPKNLLPQIYHECLVATSFVLPIKELWANSANKFFDALASGRPIVINHYGWMAEEIIKNNIGYVLNSDINDISDTAADFCKYLENGDLLRLQGKNARTYAIENYSLDIASNKFLKIIDNVLQESH